MVDPIEEWPRSSGIAARRFDRKAYIGGSEVATLQAVRAAQEVYKRPVTITELCNVARTNRIRGPRTPEVGIVGRGGHGGWQVFDFRDRTLRYLKRLEKQGKVTLYKNDRGIWKTRPVKRSFWQRLRDAFYGEI